MLIILMRKILLLLLFPFSDYCYAQVEISYSSNSPRECDSIVSQLTEYIPAGSGGEDAVWDFSGDISTSDTRTIYYSSDSTGHMICMEPERMLKFRLTEDSLLLTGYETHLRKMDYTKPICLAVFPSVYQDSYGGEFSGSGMYCGRLAIETEGSYSVEVDGTGSMCLTSGDTIPNVLRLHFLKSASVWMHEPDDTVETDLSKRRQEIEERYLWYARGYRYPLVESRSVTYYDNLCMVSDTRSSFVSNPEWINQLNDSVNQDIQVADSLVNALQPANPVMNYTMQLDSSGQLHVSYNLTSPASLTFLVCNVMGITYMSTTTRREAGEGYSADFDCSGLTHGTYLLHINCNGQVYSETFQR